MLSKPLLQLYVSNILLCYSLCACMFVCKCLLEFSSLFYSPDLCRFQLSWLRMAHCISTNRKPHSSFKSHWKWLTKSLGLISTIIQWGPSVSTIPYSLEYNLKYFFSKCPVRSLNLSSFYWWCNIFDHTLYLQILSYSPKATSNIHSKMYKRHIHMLQFSLFSLKKKEKYIG